MSEQKFRPGDRVECIVVGEVLDVRDDGRLWVRTSDDPCTEVDPRTAVVKKVAPAYEWRDGDAIQSPSGFRSLNRRDGMWDSSHPDDLLRYTDARATWYVNRCDYRVLRYRAGEGGHEHDRKRHQNVTGKGYAMPPYEACSCGVARPEPRGTP